MAPSLPSPASAPELHRNLRLIPIHQALTGALVWTPIFVLFTRARFDVDGAFLIAALYYLFVVVLEVPSGWMSDRLGRVLTLRLAALSWIGAHTCFLLGDDRMVVIVLGQALLAGGFAFLSGTDVSFHFDTLEALGKAKEYADRQARVASLGYAVAALSALIGGALGLVDLRLAFGVSLVLAIVQFGVASLMHEPPAITRAEAFVGQIGSCLAYLRSRYMAWIFFYGFALVTLEHVAFTPSQIWLTGVLDRPSDDLGATPLLAGAVFAVSALIGSIAARMSASAARRWGITTTLIGLGIVSALIVTTMAVTFSIVAVVALVFRSAQGAAAPVLISAEVAPRTAQHHRATLLSLNSLAGRLGYGLILLWIWSDAADEVAPVLRVLSVISWTLIVLLVASGYVATRATPAESPRA